LSGILFEVRRDHRGQYVVAGGSDVVVDGALEVVVNLLGHRRRGLVAAVEARFALRADHAVLPHQELVEVLQRQAEQLQEHGARKGHRELLVEVAFAPIGEAVDHLVHQLGDARFTSGHLSRSEQRVENATVLRMLGRIDLERDQRADIAEIDGVHVRREQFGALECHLDVGEATENHRLGGPEHRCRFPQCLIHRLRFRETHHRLIDEPFGFCHGVSVTPSSLFRQ
jgi:uncharacterized protein YjhX (UPF0386 family)